MKKAVAAFVLTVICGYYGCVFGDEFMNWPQLGTILAVAVMGAAIITSLEKRDE